MSALIASLMTVAEANIVPISFGLAKGVIWDRLVPSMFAGHRRRVEARQARKLAKAGGGCKRCANRQASQQGAASEDFDLPE